MTGTILAFVSALGFATMNVCVHKGFRPGDADASVLVTLVFNAAVLIPTGIVVGYSGGLPPWSTAGLLWFVLAGLVTTFLGRNTLFAAIRYAGASRAASIKNTSPAFAVAVAFLLLGEHLDVAAVVGTGLAVFGLGLLVYEAFEKERWEQATGSVAGDGRRPHLRLRGEVLAGVSLALLAAALFGSGQVVRKIGLEAVPSPVLGAAIGTCAASIAFVGLAAVRGQVKLLVKAGFGGFRGYYWLAGLCSTVGQLAFFAAAARAPVSHVSVVAATETVMTLFIARLLVGRTETITPRVAGAVACVFGGALLVAIE